MIESAVPWQDAADRALAAGWRTLVVLGATDRGKSRFCQWLVEEALRRGRDVAYVDADLGQKTIGPPAAITLGYPAPRRAVAETPAAGFHFVGATNPVGHMAEVALGTAALARSARADVVIVDTDGLVAGAGLRLKRGLLDALRPDAVVAIERGDELAALRRGLREPVLRLAPSAEALRKSPRRRAAARREAFARYFASASEIEVALADVVVEPVASAAGLPLSHRLAGTIDGEGRGTGLALVTGAGRSGGGTLRLLTPVPRDRIRRLRLGDLFLGGDGEPLASPTPPRGGV